ncbi:MAG: sulfatase [Planctomycetota bacterium]|jgi:arylsulfatase A-like enzyme|nr:sulfatase [Planctomycetota bacterium]MDP6942124.1 sulfatase [Planctomycetota bacterium]
MNRDPRIRFGFVLLALVAGLLFAKFARPELPPHNLLLVVVDTLRQDHLGIYGYEKNPTTPELDSFTREEAIRVDGLVGVSSWTMPSMATLFTGQSPAEHGVMRMTGENSRLQKGKTLAERLQEKGWSTACIQSNFLLQKRRGVRFDRGFEYWNDSSSAQPNPHRGSTAGEVAKQGLAWLDSQPESKPWFLTLHFFDPHSSYESHPEIGFADPHYSGWVQAGLENDILRKNGPLATDADRNQLAAYYDEEVRAVDIALGHIFEALKARGDWDDTIVVFTSDHGEELAERGFIGHTRTLHHEQINLPLIVRLPGSKNRGTYAETLLTQKDLCGTMLELATGSTDMSSFAELFEGTYEPNSCIKYQVPLQALGYLEHPDVRQVEVDFVPVRAEHAEKRVRKRGLVGEQFRWFRNLQTGEESLYDTKEDPAERRNLVADPEWQGLLKELRAYEAELQWWDGE